MAVEAKTKLKEKKFCFSNVLVLHDLMFYLSLELPGMSSFLNDKTLLGLRIKFCLIVCNCSRGIFRKNCFHTIFIVHFIKINDLGIITKKALCCCY